MNKSILLVICDFLILSLLALARFDKAEPVNQPEQEQAVVESQVKAGDDMVELLRMSLEAEQSEKQQLASELESAQKKEASAQLIVEDLNRSRERLLEEKKAVLQQQEKLAQQLQITESEKARVLSEQSQLKEDLIVVQERQRMLQDQLKKREITVEKMQSDMRMLEDKRATVERDNAVLNTKLQSAAVEKKRLELEMETVRKEKERVQEQAQNLAQGVTRLADNSAAMKDEIRQLQPLSINEVFSNFQRNRLRITFKTREISLLGESDNQYEVFGLIVHDRDQYAALVEISETPLYGANWFRILKLSVSIEGGADVKIPALRSSVQQPFVIQIPLTDEWVANSGKKPYELTADPFRYSSAVLLTADGDRYGEAAFKLKPENTSYLTIDGRILTRLFGEFSPSRGDFLLSRSGEFMGIMTTNNEARILSVLDPKDTLPLGDGFSSKVLEAFRQKLGLQ
jgi:hypothetical protein